MLRRTLIIPALVLFLFPWTRAYAVASGKVGGGVIKNSVLFRDTEKVKEAVCGMSCSRERSIMHNDVTIERGLRTGPYRSLLAVFLVIFICMILLQAGPAIAEDEKFPDRFMLRLGSYQVQNAETVARLDANNAPVGAYIDFSKDLGLDSSATVGRLDGLYRFNDHHALGFAWYALKFAGSRSINKEIDWGNLPTITVGQQVNSEIRFDVYKVSYQYSVFHNEQAELGALFGFHIMKTFVGINAVGIGEAKNTAITAPLPVLGLYADYHFTPRTSVYYNFQVFAVNYENKVKGGLQDFLLGVEYRLFPNVALGAAYNKFNLNLEVVADAATLLINTGWNGGMLYGALYF
jgi:hypothetical protein